MYRACELATPSRAAASALMRRTRTLPSAANALLHSARPHCQARCCSSPSAPPTCSEETRKGRKQGYDATARRPTKVCDPYENNGQPLSELQCAQLLPTLGDAWALTDGSSALIREVEVDNFVKGARVLSTIAAVAFNNNHYPVLTLERRIGKRRRWQEVVVIRCTTTVLRGLSYQDFLLTSLIDVELEKRGPGMGE